MILGEYDFDQFWNLFKKFVEFHRNSGVYPPDVRSLLEMDEDFVRDDLRKLLEKARTSDDVLAIFEWRNGKMIAFSVATAENYWAGGTLISIDMVYVDEGYRGKGIGKAMLERMIKWAKEKDARVMNVYVAVGNEAMLNLLEKYGFIPFNIELRKMIEDK